MRPTPDRADVVAMLATLGERPVESVGERIDSLELAWLVHQVEQRYGLAVELGDEDLRRMSTVSDAVDVFREVLARDGGDDDRSGR